MFRSKHSHRKQLSRTKAASAEDAGVRSAEDTLMSLAAQRAELATGYEMMLHTEETAAATQQLERASAKAERKEAAFLEAMRPRRSQAFVAPILSRSERLAVRAAEIAEDHAASSMEMRSASA